jgi:predicted NAD-dependent protein-ADP-ribosyltransferase YbiA (DUF1768 family)
VTLTYLLQTNYQNITSDQYTLAKKQQIVKENARLEEYKDNLYRLYENKDLPVYIVNMLEYKPIFPESKQVSLKNLSSVDANVFDLEKLIQDTKITFGDLIIDESLMPFAPDPVTIDGRTFNTVTHYAYNNLFASIYRNDINVNEYTNIHNLVKDYNAHKNKMIEDRITINNEKATFVKLTKSDSIRALLLSTKGRKIFWSDSEDMVLGSKQNRMGFFLDFIRDNQNNQITFDKTLQILYPKNDDIVFRNWFISRAEDYANTLKMFEKVDVIDLENIYNVRAITTTIRYTQEVFLSGVGIDQSKHDIVIKCIYGELLELVSKTKNRLVEEMINALVTTYNQTRPENIIRDNAETKLKQIYKLVKFKLFPKINKLQFVSSILSCEQTYNVDKGKWWRVNKWGNM